MAPYHASLGQPAGVPKQWLQNVAEPMVENDT